MNKKQANRMRGIVDDSALKAAHASYASEVQEQAQRPEFVQNYRRALVDVSHEMADLNHIETVQRFDSDVALSLDLQETVKEWRAWFREFNDAIKARDKAKQALDNYDKDGLGGLGYWMAVEAFTQDRDEAQEIIDRLKDGPVLDGGEGVEFDDPNYLPF